MEFTSDCESILTEDFALKFTEIITDENCRDSGFSYEKSERDNSTPIGNTKFPKLESRTNNDKSRFKNIKPSTSKTTFHQMQDIESDTMDAFEDRFQNIFSSINKVDPNSDRSAPVESSNTSINVDMGNISNVQPMRRDIMNKFLAKYSLDENQILYQVNNEEKKLYQNDASTLSRDNSKKLHFSGVLCPKEEQRRNKENFIRHDIANEIRTKSLRIQNEIHEERKRKLESIQEKSIINEQTPREKLDLKVKELDHLTDRMRQARSDRERITAELNQLKNNIRMRPFEIHKDNKWSDNSKNNNDGKPFQSVSQNFKLQVTQNQLGHLNFQLNQKKSQLRDLELVIRERLKEIQDLEYIGLSKQEIKQVIEERNDLYEILRQSEENGNDRYELEKQLTEAKEDLSMEYKRSREKIMNLEEELDNCFKKITELHEERDKMSREIYITKDNMQRLHDEMSELYQERNELKCQVDKYKEEIEAERLSSQEIINQEKKRLESHLATEEAQSKIKQSELMHVISLLESEKESMIEKNSAMKSKLSQVENECQKFKQLLDQKENEYREHLQKTNEEKNQTIEKLKKDFYTNQLNEIQTLKTEFDSEQIRTINNLRDCYKQQVSDLQLRIENKSQEIQDIRSEIRKMKQEFSDKEESIKFQFETEISHLKDENRKNLDIMDDKRISQLDEMKVRYEGLTTKMNKEIDEERLLNEQLQNALDKVNKELAHECELVKKYKNEKIVSINRIKEVAKEKLQEEYKNLKLFYEKELEEQLKIVEKTMQEKNCQLIDKCREIKKIQSNNEEGNCVLLSVLNDFIDTLKHQCTDMANNAKFISPQWKNLKITENDDVSFSLQSAMRNLQICCQEYSQYYHENIDKIKIDKDQSLKAIEEKHSKDIEMIREQILKDHAKELNSLKLFNKHELNTMKLKHQEEIDGIKMGVKAWKCKTAERLAQKLQKEFRKEIEKKSSKPEMKMSSSLSLHSFKHDIPINNSNPIGLIEDLRGNIRQLREENLSLRKVILGKSCSVFQQNEDDNNGLQSSFNRSNGNNSPVNVSTRPQSASQENYRNKSNSKDSFVQRSNSFKNYS